MALGDGYCRNVQGAQERCQEKMRTHSLLKTHAEKFRWVKGGGKVLMAGWLRSFQLSACRPADGADAGGLGAWVRTARGPIVDLRKTICALLSVAWQESRAGFL